MNVFVQSKKLKELLIRKNKSQNWLARRLQISPAYLSQLLTGTRKPSPKTRESIQRIFNNEPFDELFRIDQ